MAFILLIAFLISGLQVTAAQYAGVCNGRVADNLPSEEETVDFFESNGIGRMRIYNPDSATLQALRGRNIELMLGVPNEILPELAANQGAAANWVQTNIIAYSPDVKFRYIAVGNEVDWSDPLAKYVLPAMQNIRNAILAANLDIKVSTSIKTSLLGNSYPPSIGEFSASAAPYIIPIVHFLAGTGAPLLANVYPYFAYIGETQNIDLGFALFSSPGIMVQDTNSGLGYQNIFDTMLDALYSALEKVGAPKLEVVVSETGWPSAGGVAATVENAATYYKNMINHVQIGTPKRPGRPTETYLFAMFDEYQKGPEETERNFGLFSPSKRPKYNLQFSQKE